MPALFDSRDPAYRSPFGAVAVNTAVFFRICLPRCWGCHGASLLVEQDGRPTRQMGMFWAGMAGDDHEWWDIRFAPGEPAIYFYGFQLELALGTGWLVRQPDGTAAYSYAASTPLWQLTAYAADFTTPDWLAGGIIYTIGGVIYALKLPLFNSRHKGFGSHEVFHLFVMAGSICHFIFMYRYIA